MTDIIVLLIVAVLVIFCIRQIIRNKKQEGASGCVGCAGGCGKMSCCGTREDDHKTTSR